MSEHTDAEQMTFAQFREIVNRQQGWDDALMYVEDGLSGASTPVRLVTFSCGGPAGRAVFITGGR